MNWLDNLQKLGGQAYGAVKNKGPIAARGPKSALKTGAAGKAAEKLKVGSKGFKFGPEQADALMGILSPVVELLNKRRNR